MTSYEIPRKFTRHVVNQKSEGCCLALVIADMVSIILRRSGEEREDIVISPQPLIEGKVETIPDINDFCKDVGFESIQTWPFTRIRTGEWKLEEFKEEYMSRNNPRHYIGGVNEFYCPDLIKKEIEKNFSNEGNKFPIMCAVYLGDFAKDEVARNAMESDKPYSHPSNDIRAKRLKTKYVEYSKESGDVKKGKKRGKRKIEVEEEERIEEHALLIVGCDTTSENVEDHCAIVKGSHGYKWASKGFSKVKFEVLLYILVPVHNPGESDEECNEDEEGHDIKGIAVPLDKETDPQVLEKCIFIEGLPLFTPIKNIEDAFLNICELPEEPICLVSRDELTYTRSAIVQTSSKEVVKAVLRDPNVLGNFKFLDDIKLDDFKGMEFHPEVYQKGRYKLILNIPKRSLKRSEKKMYEYVEELCHPYDTITMMKDNYIPTGQFKVSFRTHEDMTAAHKRLTEMEADSRMLQPKHKTR